MMLRNSIVAIMPPQIHAAKVAQHFSHNAATVQPKTYQYYNHVMMPSKCHHIAAQHVHSGAVVMSQ